MKEMYGWRPFGHNCQGYIPKGAKVGDTFKCVCGTIYTCTRRWPWRKWEYQE